MKSYILILSILFMQIGTVKSQSISDTSLLSGVYVMELRVQPKEDHYIFGFIPWAEGVSVLPLGVAIALILTLIFGLILFIYEKITLKKRQ